MSSQQHIVQKLTVEIGLSSQDVAFDLQTKITNEYKRLVLSSMGEVFDSLVDAGEFFSIDKLEIDIGTIAMNELEHELPGKIKAGVEEAVTRLLHEARSTPGGSAEVRMVTKQGDILIVQTSLKDQSHSLFEALFYLLEFGVLPWSSDRKEKPGLNFLLSEAIKNNPGVLRTGLKQLQNKPHVFRRLAMQVREEQLVELAHILGRNFSSRLPVFLKEITALTNTKSTTKSKTQSKTQSKAQNKIVTPDELRIFFWQESLRYFVTNEEQLTGGAQEKKYLLTVLKSVLAEFELATLKNTNDCTPVLKEAIKEAQEEKKIPGAIKKDDEELLLDSPAAEEGIYIANAGLVILAAYLAGFFKNIGFVKGNEFVSETMQWKAVHLLQWMVYGDRDDAVEVGAAENEETNEHDLAFNKILCGIDIAEPIPENFYLSDDEKDEATALLKAVIENWDIIKRSSTRSLQITFLQKEGRLKRMGSDWDLLIERDSAVDMLIDRLPWSIGMIRLPWSTETVHVTW